MQSANQALSGGSGGLPPAFRKKIKRKEAAPSLARSGLRSGLMMVCAARFASGADKASLLVTSKSLSMACQRHTHYAVHKKLLVEGDTVAIHGGEAPALGRGGSSSSATVGSCSHRLQDAQKLLMPGKFKMVSADPGGVAGRNRPRMGGQIRPSA